MPRVRTTCVAAVFFVAMAAEAQAQFTVPPVPSFEGPISEGGPMYTGLRALTAGTAPGDFAYLTEEYFVSGIANGEPYRTRILVRKPETAERFSGVVVSESMHSNGFAETFEPARKSILMRGHVHVEIAAQQANVASLKAFNAVRYSSLAVPSFTSNPQNTQAVSDIIAQVGVLIKSNLSKGPLAPLSARRLILQGTSQASAVLRNYQAQKHFQARMPGGGAIVDGYLATSTYSNPQLMKVVDVPTVHMPTMTEVNNGPTFRRPDSDEPGNRYRLYEVAGMAHANARDNLTYAPNSCALPVSDFPWGAMVAMGLNHLVEWIDKSIVPPHAPPLEFDNNSANDGSRLALDENGNVKGGVRNTYVDVPVAAYGVSNAPSRMPCDIAGWRVAYDEQTLRELYKNHVSYMSRVHRRLMELMREGWMLPEYADDVRADALAVSIPNAGR